MNPVRSLKNQYRGINAHMHSSWQSEGGWNEFHVNHIADLTRLMRIDLYPMGYIARTEQSLQIRRIDSMTQTPKSDILILDQGATLRVVEPVRRYYGSYEEMVLPASEALGLEEIDYHKAVAIYKADRVQGEPVAWVELLSPSNKPNGQDWRNYKNKREALLQAGIVFVEIDYLHESPVTLELMSVYSASQAKTSGEAWSAPYRIIVIDPRPELSDAEARVRMFRVDDLLPTIRIPLLGEDALDFDFGKAYDKTFSEMLYGNEVDYARFPLNFDRYNQSDQARIANRMLAVLKASQAGVDLEQAAPLPIEPVTLDEALNQLKAFAGG
jgi:hypothetical protein